MHSSSPASAIDRLCAAINAHDLDAMVACFTADYDSSFPAHPDRAFRGHEQVRKNWGQIFGAVPDLSATLVRSTQDRDVVWAEWDWQGTRRDGVPFHQRGVTIQGVKGSQLTWARLYMESVDEGRGVDGAIQEALASVDRSQEV